MGNPIAAAENVANTVARSHAGVCSHRGHGLPRPKLRLQPCFEVVRGCLDAGQRPAQEPQSLKRKAFRDGVGARGAIRLHRVVDCSDSRGKKQPLRGCNRRGRVEDHGPRREQPVADPLLGLGARVGNAGDRGEFRGGQRGRHGDHADRIGRRHRWPRVGPDIRVYLVRRLKSEPQAQLNRLGGIDHRAAADRYQHIGCRSPHLRRGGNHVRPRAVRTDLNAGSSVLCTECRDHPLERPVFKARQRPGADHEDTPGAVTLHFREHGRAGGRPEQDPLLGLDGDVAGNH